MKKFHYFPIFFIYLPLLLAQDQIASYREKAKKLADQGRYLEAAQLSEKAVELEKGSDNPRLGVLAEISVDVGNYYQQLGRLALAIRSYRYALTLFRKIGEEKSIGDVQQLLGIAYRSQEHYRKSLTHLRKALENAQKSGKEIEEAAILEQVAATYESTNHYQRAIEQYKQALAVFQKCRESGDTARLLCKIATLYRELRHFDSAIDNYFKALEYIVDDEQKADVLLDIAAIYRQNREQKKALELQQRALEILEKAMKGARVADVLVQMGGVYRDLDQYKNALEYFTKALRINQDLQLRAEEASAEREIGMVYFSMRKLDEARASYKKSISLNLALERYAAMADVYIKIAIVDRTEGKYRHSLEKYEKALEIAHRIDNPELVTSSLEGIGHIYFSLNDHSAAASRYEQALAIAERQQQAAAKVRVLNGLGEVYQGWEKYPQALAKFQEALEIVRQQNDLASIARQLNNVGVAQFLQRQYLSAVEFYQQALESAREAGNPEEEAKAFSNIGQVYQSWGQPTKAIEYHRKAIEILPGEKQQTAISLFRIGLSYKVQKQRQNSQAHLLQSLDIASRLGASHLIWEITEEVLRAYREEEQLPEALDIAQMTLENVQDVRVRAKIAMEAGRLCVTLKRLSEALGYYQQALDIAVDLDISEDILAYMSDIGKLLYLQGKYREAQDYFHRSLAMSQQLQKPAVTALAFRSIARTYYQQKQYEKAIANFEQALSLYKELASLSDVVSIWTSMAAVQYSLGEYERAITCINEAIYLEAKSRSSAKILSQEAIQRYRALASCYIRLHQYDSALTTLEQLHEILASKIGEEFPATSLRQAREQISSDVAILIYAYVPLNDEFLYIVLQRDVEYAGIVSCREFIRSEWKKYERELQEDAREISFVDIIDYYNSLYQEKAEGHRELGRSLYELLIRPLEEHVVEKNELLIVAEGFFSLLAFETLQDQQGKHLQMKYSIRYSSSVQSALASIQRRRSSSPEHEEATDFYSSYAIVFAVLAIWFAIFFAIRYGRQVRQPTQQKWLRTTAQIERQGLRFEVTYEDSGEKPLPKLEVEQIGNCLVDTRNNIHIFTCRSGQIEHFKHLPDGQWQREHIFGENIEFSPSALIKDRRLYVFACRHKRISCYRYTKEGWQEIDIFGEGITSSPSAVICDGAIHVFAKKNGGISQYVKRGNGGWEIATRG